MIEITRGGSERLILHTGTSDGPQDAVSLPTIEIFDMDTDLLVDSGVSERIAIGEYSYVTPLSLATTDRMLRAVWSFSIDVGGGDIQSGTHTQLIQVTAPYTTPQQVKDRYPNATELQSATLEEIRDAEKTIRYVINSFVGQDFNLETGKTYAVRGAGLKELHLPKRLIRLTSVESEDGYQYGATMVSGTGWVLRKSGEALPYSAYQDGQTVYHAPVGGAGRGVWREGTYYVKGDWGWSYVPAEVVEAANILLRDYFCSDSKYFEHYIDNIRAADWRMEFAKTGDATTGNARADILLQPFTRSNYAVL